MKNDYSAAPAAFPGASRQPTWGRVILHLGVAIALAAAGCAWLALAGDEQAAGPSTLIVLAAAAGFLVLRDTATLALRACGVPARASEVQLHLGAAALALVVYGYAHDEADPRVYVLRYMLLGAPLLCYVTLFAWHVLFERK